ncbi:MAG TPA: helix-turn-helix transcriptional regulator [Gaiellaceae bacterium]|jgi:PadR family transcriptional regulator PadR|nr:helix-turn-helix transcriptional regulator [Gaiellaceae bacterium]
MRSDSVKGYLELLLLAELDRGPGHGYALIERLRDRSAGTFAFPEGTIYPALHRLERGGMLTSEWSTGKARRRRIYSIRRHGRAVLQDHLREWRLFARAVERVVAA